MAVREFQSSDGSRWRVWDVQPAKLLGERRSTERRVTPVETLADPPALELRRGGDRRQSRTRSSRRAPATLLPDAWQRGWLVFERIATAVAARADQARREVRREVRRLAPLPACWDGCTADDLAEHLAQAVAY